MPWDRFNVPKSPQDYSREIALVDALTCPVCMGSRFICTQLINQPKRSVGVLCLECEGTGRI